MASNQQVGDPQLGLPDPSADHQALPLSPHGFPLSRGSGRRKDHKPAKQGRSSSNETLTRKTSTALIVVRNRVEEICILQPQNHTLFEPPVGVHLVSGRGCLSPELSVTASAHGRFLPAPDPKSRSQPTRSVIWYLLRQLFLEWRLQLSFAVVEKF